VTIALAQLTLVAAITAQQASCAAEPVRGTPYYYCDCGTGAAANCVAGDDGNAGTDPAAPRKTIANAVARYLAGMTGINTFAFCKGGAFDATASINLSRAYCAAGSTCTDIREYASPKFASAAKPIFNSPQAATSLIKIAGNGTTNLPGGIRLLNLRLKGIGLDGNPGLFLYNGAHDVTACNLDIDGFSQGIQQVPDYPDATINPVAPVSNVVITGNNFTNNTGAAYLGSGDTSSISKNLLLDNGSNNGLNHTIYLSSDHSTTTGFEVTQNYMHGQLGSTCYGVMLVGHGRLTNLKIQNNALDIDETADTMGCYGIALDHGGYNHYTDFSNAVISGNELSNTGGIGIAVANCAGCLIENNVLAFNATENYGIVSGEYAARTICPNGSTTDCLDVVNSNNTIRNNTIWFGPNAINGTSGGISVRNEGTGHIVANNTVSYTATTTTNHPIDCFDYPLSLSSYTFIDNNHCYSAYTAAAYYRWEKSNGTTLDNWRSYSASKGFDSASLTAAPAFVNTISAPFDFHPGTGSPLRGAGSHAHAPATDMTGSGFLNPPAIGAYE
jgi:parallel beta-helix repeat protein